MPPHSTLHRPIAALALALALAPAIPSALGGEDPATDPIHLGCPDPAIISAADGSGYTIFCTGEGLPIWRSSDLRRWHRNGRVFETDVPAWAKEAIPKTRGIWAPDISFYNGKYHLYYSVSSFGSQRSAIGLAVNSSLHGGGWEDRGLVIESSPGEVDFNAIDPALFVDGDGSPYLFWGSYWTGIKATRIDPATGKPDRAPPKVLPIAGRSPGVDPPAIEAPYVIHREGCYYLFVSWDFCCAGAKSTYKIMVGRSRSILGPYVDDQDRPMLEGGGRLVLESSDRWRGPGHNSLLQTGDGDWLVLACYDARNERAGRLLQIRPLTWKEGWPEPGEPIELRMGR